MKKLLLLIVLVFSYQFFFGTFLFLFDIEKESSLRFDLQEIDVQKDQAKAQIVDDNLKALDLRLAFIQNSTSSIQIAVHQFHHDHTSNLITSALIERLKDGVEVDIIIDGIMNTNLKANNYQLLSYYGANFKVYEPNVFLFPQRGQNRLHDKIFIFDEEYAIVSGRNIGDRYFVNTATAVHDRDVYFSDQETVKDVADYFMDLFASNYAVDLKTRTPDFEVEEEMQEAYQTYKNQMDLETLFQEQIAHMIPVDGLLFLHNPINRLKKESLLMDTLIELVKREEKAIIQSPYIVFDQDLQKDFSDLDDLDVKVLVNTVQTSPNIFASSGYIYDRKEIAKTLQVYEIQSDQSRHTKTWLIGDDYLAVGSLNIDPRSTSLSTESMLLVKSTQLHQTIQERMEDELNQSFLFTEEGTYLKEEGIVEVETNLVKETAIRLIGLVTYFFHDLL